MNSSWLMTGLALTESAACLAALMFIRRSGQFSLWRGLSLSLALECLTNPIALWLAHRSEGYAAYFYFYWGTSVAQTLIRLYIAAEVAQSFPQSKEIPNGMRSFMAAFCVGAAGLGFVLANHDYSTFPRALSTLAIVLNKDVSVAWYMGILGGLILVKVIGFGWDYAGAGVANAFTLRMVCAAMSALLVTTHSFQMLPWASGIDSFASFATPLLLCYTFSRAPVQPLHSPDPPKRMNLEELDLYIKSLLRQER